MAYSREPNFSPEVQNCKEKPTEEKLHLSNISFLQLTEFLASNPSIRFIRYQWVDLFGILRVRVLPKAHSLSLAATNSPLTLGPFAHAILVDGTMIPDTKPAGVDSLYPDWSSLNKFNSGKNGDLHYASVMCWVSESNCDSPNLAYQRCPRSALQRTLTYAKHTIGLEFLIGFEIEFIVTRNNGAGNDRTPLGSDEGIWTASSTRNPVFAFVEESVDALTALGIRVQQFHSEGAAGQFEISTAPLPPLQAVDVLILTHETIKNVFAQHGHGVTMYPKPFDNLPSNGAHTHISIVGRSAADEKSDAFLAGLLRRIPSLCAFTMPTHDSYIRVKRLEAGDRVAWGSQNRTVPLREVRRGHWELRFVDATANMYLALAVCVAAGTLGVCDGEPLRWRDSIRAHGEKEKEEEEEGEEGEGDDWVAKRLPQSLEEALSCVAEHKVDLSRVLGSELVERYLQLKEYEKGKVGKMDVSARRRLYLQKFG